MTIVSEKKKFDGSVVKQAEAVAGDGTGVVTLIARNGKFPTASLTLLCRTA